MNILISNILALPIISSFVTIILLLNKGDEKENNNASA